jgi:hypothetical protein
VMNTGAVFYANIINYESCKSDNWSGRECCCSRIITRADQDRKQLRQ